MTDESAYVNWYWLNDDSRTFLSRGYIREGCTPEARVREIAVAAEKTLGIDGFADKFCDYMSRGWFSLSSPVWSNFGLERGLPCSCNGSYIPDTTDGILRKVREVGIMTKYGAGTSAYFGGLRGRRSQISSGGTSSGAVHFMELYDCTTNVISQGSVRRGQFAAYLPIEHPDVMEFLRIRSDGHPIQNISIGLTVTDRFMNDMIAGDRGNREVWAAVIRKRYESGYPYLFFTDTVNRTKHQAYKDHNLTIHASNLCSEICQPSSDEESFVCVLSSMNLLHCDEWKHTDAVRVLALFLDAVTSEYIRKTAGIPGMEAAHRFARRHRAIGIGVLGWHSYLQSRMIPFESMHAKMLNGEIFKFLDHETMQASIDAAHRYGSPEVLDGYMERWATRLAIAPTKSSSFILGQVSQGIEPINSNYYVEDLAKGKFTYRNPYLQQVLEMHGRNDEDIWRSILVRGGSVQHLDFLTDHEKAVFRTFGEISQREIVIQAAGRQKYIDQSQSLNLMIPPEIPPKEVSDLLIEGWQLGIKTFYYQKSANPAQELARSILTCSSCEA